MVNRYLFLSILFLASCGKQVDISNRKLEYNSSLSDGKNLPDKDGMIFRGTPDRISYAGGNYEVSIYSSYQALEFIAARPLNTQHAVKFKGTPKSGKMVLEIVQAK